MEIQSTFNAARAIEQSTRSAEMMNQLNRNIVDSVHETANKLLRVNVEQKLSADQEQQTLDLLA
ncbi:MAG: hypothetical protein K1X75_15090 [Leptospirales bacterium]|nr:hypothetical protein [Leptospirales bacterium]